MEQAWVETLPVSLLQEWEITQEVQTWIEANNKQKLETDNLYQDVVTQILKLRELTSVEEVKDHIQLLMRLLATQFENEREDQDCDTKVRILQHAQAIHKLLEKKAFNLRDHLEKLKMKIFPDKEAETSKKNPLPVTEKEMIDLEDRLLRYAECTKQPMTLSLAVHDESTCWNNLLTQEQKNKNITFIRKCGECNFQHEFPKCGRCKTPRRQI